MAERELQLKRTDGAADVAASAEAPQATGGATYTSRGAIPSVDTRQGTAQRSASDRAFGENDRTHKVAERGVSGNGQALPHADRIAQSFGGEHAATVQGIQAHVGGEAAQANAELGAQAYAHGDSIAFGATPDLHTAAHEAAHVVQQRSGVHLKGGVGEEGDAYENHANAVADRVVQGKPAGDLLAPFAGGAGGGKAVQSKAVQFLGHKLGEPLPEGAEKPVYGEDHDQRRYSREQYEHMWEEEQGRKLKDGEKDTIRRGCIGITANNIAGGGNPLQYAEATFGDFDHAHKYMQGKNKELHEMRADPSRANLAPDGEYIVFAKLFWSNQKEGDNSKPDDKAFLADPKTGRMDMTGYKYKAQPGYVNFDYGFWDESTQSFWHANHMEYRDPAQAKKDPMKVYQSTKEHFVRGYIDFDRIVFGVARATNYDPGKAAIDTANR